MKKLLPSIAVFIAFQVNAQSYLVTFGGTGESNSVDSVRIENLASGTTLTLDGTDVLRLNLATGMESQGIGQSSNLKIYPNPMSEYAFFEISPPFEGEAVISVFDICGRQVFHKVDFLGYNEQEFRLSGLRNGLYIINIQGNGYRFSGKLSCEGKHSGEVKIEKIINPLNPLKKSAINKNEDTGILATIDMPYDTGQWIKFKGFSGDFITVATSTFEADKQVVFNFIRCKDGDEINYPVVEIGSQVWMASNLRTSKYNNGDPIGTTEPKTLNIASETNPKYEWVYYGYELQMDTVAFGRLYTWHAATDLRNVCPAGWHLPSRNEWDTLFTTLGGSSVAGGKLKETGFTHWLTPNTDASNVSGFTALPNGNRAPTGSCTNYTKIGYLWSASEKDGNYAWYCGGISYNGSGAFSDINTGKNVGLGVRCVKD